MMPQVPTQKVKPYRKRDPGKRAKGSARPGGSLQVCVNMTAGNLDRIRRIADKNELSLSTTLRELALTGLRLAESGSPWRGQ